MPLLRGLHSAMKPGRNVCLTQQVGHSADIHFHWVQGTDGRATCLRGAIKYVNYYLGHYLSHIQ